MRVSHLLGRTSKTEGVDYEITSHRLLVQAGFIRESTAGRYYLLPLGVRVQEKIIKIIRDHMNDAGAQEVLMPVLHPIELWQETNRTSTTGFELMRVKDRRDSEFVLGGTAEEMAVDLVRKFNLSYKDLPFNIYQFSMKFRDELRARGGLLRVREFIMKDAYSFSTEAKFKDIYTKMWQVYENIFKDMGLNVNAVASDNGYIGGEYCHEFISESDAGESTYFITDDGNYGAHEDVAVFTKYQEPDSGEEMKTPEEVEGVGIIGVEELSKHLGIPIEKTTKTVLFETDKGDLIAAAVNGIYDINEVKLQHVVGAAEIRLASPETIKRVTGAEVGYLGFLNLPDSIRVVLDESVGGRRNIEMGANRTNYHMINVNIGRDCPEPERYWDIAKAKAGYLAPDGKQKLVEKRGIEVGNIFQLGYHYSRLMNGCEYTDEHGQKQKLYMGCYGIGVGRSLAAAVEAHHDSKGIIWPASIAPALVYLVKIGDGSDIVNKAEEVYKKLEESGIETMYDDRDLSVGERFADADLVGVPYRVVVSRKTLDGKGYELKKRTETEAADVSQDELLEILASAQTS